MPRLYGIWGFPLVKSLRPAARRCIHLKLEQVEEMLDFEHIAVKYDDIAIPPR